MAKGKINVSVENIFPLIKKFLYSDQEIFLRELISNATDALTKIQHLSSVGEVKGEIGKLGVDIRINKKKKTLHIIDNGVGMTLNEVKKYINDVAFSGAEEFLEKYHIFFCPVYTSSRLAAEDLKISRVAPDIRPFWISGIRLDIRFLLPDIRLEKKLVELKTEDK